MVKEVCVLSGVVAGTEEDEEEIAVDEGGRDWIPMACAEGLYVRKANGGVSVAIPVPLG